MNKLNRYLPVVFAMIALTVFGMIIYKHKTHLKHGQDIYIQLAPVDPRSLIQGDYMRLGYEFYFNDNPNNLSAYQNHHHVKIWVLTDNKNVVIKSGFHQNEFTPDEQIRLRPLIVNNPTNSILGFYSASSSFLFAEGLADCYGKAAFAHQKTDDKGNPILVDLVGDDLRSLNCKSSH